jgi:hypothetical protein
MARQYDIDHLDVIQGAEFAGTRRTGRHQHGAMALLDSGQFHQEPIPAYVMCRTAVVATGERGEHDKGTKPADNHPHHHAGADRFTSGKQYWRIREPTREPEHAIC